MRWLYFRCLVPWFLAEGQTRVALSVRSWYRHKTGYGFLDILRAAQTTLRDVDILPPHREGAEKAENTRAPGSLSGARRRAA
jgi:hypothetical protein